MTLLENILYQIMPVSGRMSENDYASLISMYGVTEPTDNDRAKQERIKYLNSLGTGGIK